MRMHDGKLHPVRFCDRVLKENKVSYHPAKREELALLHLLNVTQMLFAGKTIHVYTRFSLVEWLFTSKALYGRAASFAVLLSPYHLKIRRVNERDVYFAQLLKAPITPAVGLDDLLQHVFPPTKQSANVRLDPELLYARVPPVFTGLVISFDGSVKTEKNGGYGSC